MQRTEVHLPHGSKYRCQRLNRILRLHGGLTLLPSQAHTAEWQRCRFAKRAGRSLRPSGRSACMARSFWRCLCHKRNSMKLS